MVEILRKVEIFGCVLKLV